MPNPIKYNTSAETLALKKGNFWIGTGDVSKGPTSSTGYYNGITPPLGGYVIYLNKETGGPSIYTVTTEVQMVSLTNSIGSQNFTTSGQCLNWFATQTDKMIFNRDYEPIVTNGLVLNLDDGFTPSYPTIGITNYSITSGNFIGTLTNGVTFGTQSSGVLIFDGVDDYLPTSANATDLGLNGSFTIQMCLKPYVVSPTVTNVTNKGLILCSNGGTNKYLHILIRDQKFMLGFYSNDLYGSQLLSANTWYIVTFRYNSETQKRSILINGVLDSEDTSVAFSGGTAPVVICGVYNQPFNGEMSSTFIYNRALTNNEVLQNYNALKGRYGLS